MPRPFRALRQLVLQYYTIFSASGHRTKNLRAKSALVRLKVLKKLLGSPEQPLSSSLRSYTSKPTVYNTAQSRAHSPDMRAFSLGARRKYGDRKNKPRR